MASNKNQHYVPKVHLNPFTLRCEGNAINMLNLDRMKAIQNVSVSGQCSGDYFYGQDERLETAINTVESAYGAIIRSLTSVGDISPGVDIVLRRFIYLQHVRTDAAARKSSEMMSTIANMPHTEISFPPFREMIKSAVQSAMLHYANSMEIVNDLKLCVCRNKTDVPFVTSDNPAILTNRLLLQRPQPMYRGFGAKTAGAVFFLPLTPSLLAILYDGDVYSLIHNSRQIEITRQADINAINQLQFMSCAANIYFKSWDGHQKTLHDAQAALPLRPETAHTVHYATLDETNDWGKRYIVRPATEIQAGEETMIHVITNHPKPKSWPSFLRFRSDAKAWSNNTGAGLTRRGCLENGIVTSGNYRKIRV